MLHKVVEVYKNNLENNLTQTQFLQLLLDMKYLVHLYNGNVTKVGPHFTLKIFLNTVYGV